MNQANNLKEIIEAMKTWKKPDLNLAPGFTITAEYRLGEIRGYNQAIEDVLFSLEKYKRKGI